MIINKCQFRKIINIRNNLHHFSTKIDFDDILPDHFRYSIPKYVKNPETLNFPWLINGAPSLEIKVIIYI